MMRQYYLIEDKLPPKLSVITSPKISKEINAIYACNQDNTDALCQWDEYIEGLKSYISNPVIAWDYNNKYPRFPNGAIHLKKLGYDVTFIVKTSHRTNRSYVYVLGTIYLLTQTDKTVYLYKNEQPNQWLLILAC